MATTFDVYFSHVLGDGGEGRVFLARCRKTHVYYALKVSSEPTVTAQRRALEHEKKRALKAAGDGVVGLVSWNLSSAMPFLVYELALEGSLATEMEQMRAMGLVYRPEEALSRVRGILVALHTAHSRGVIHRDVKPGNALLVGGYVKLTDFGIGRTLDRPTELQTQYFVGTPAYAAPEQAYGGKVDHRADIYATGVILYELLMGARPTYARPMWLPSSRMTSATPALDIFVNWLLQPDPRHRPQTAFDAIAYLDQVVAQYRDLRIRYAVNGWSSPY